MVGFRVNQYRWSRRLFGKTWNTKSEGILEGDMMDDGSDDDGIGYTVDFESVPVILSVTINFETSARLHVTVAFPRHVTAVLSFHLRTYRFW